MVFFKSRLNILSSALTVFFFFTFSLRSLVMSFPAEGVESAIKNNIEDVRLFLDSKHPGRYAVYNLSPRSYRPSRFHNRVCKVVLLSSIMFSTWQYCPSHGTSSLSWYENSKTTSIAGVSNSQRHLTCRNVW